jgi:hypothetical protein
MLAHSPRAFPWEQDLPWALARVREIIAVGPERADRASETACARGAVASTKRGAGTSATVRSRSACGRFVAGRRHGARPNVAGMAMSEPSTPRQRRSAVSEPNLCPRPLKTPKLRPRVVTQPIFFSLSLCDRPGCHERPVISVRNPAHYCSPACRQAVRNVQDRERKWLSRGTLDGQKKRFFEYQAARCHRDLQQGRITNPSRLRAPPD